MTAPRHHSFDIEVPVVVTEKESGRARAAEMVPDEGIGPPTFGLQNRCSTAELIRRLFATRLPRTDQARAAYREIRANSRRAQAEEKLGRALFWPRQFIQCNSRGVGDV